MLIPFVYRMTTFVTGTNFSYYSVCGMSDGGCGCNAQARAEEAIVEKSHAL